jgi:hypothetical protein
MQHSFFARVRRSQKPSLEVRPVTWFKVLNPAYTQKRGRREMFDRFRQRPRRDPL